MPLNNDELTKLRSRIYRGYRAPMAVSNFDARERISNVVYDGNGNIEEITHEVSYPDGTKATRREDFTLDVNGRVQSSTITYTYEDITP